MEEKEKESGNNSSELETPSGAHDFAGPLRIARPGKWQFSPAPEEIADQFSAVIWKFCQ